MQCSAVRYGVVLYVVRCAAARYSLRYGALRCGTVRCGGLQYGVVRVGYSEFEWYGAVYCGTMDGVK